MIVSLNSLTPGKTYKLQFAGVRPDGTVTEWTNTYDLVVPADSVHPAPTGGSITFPNGAGNFRVSWSAPVGGVKPDFKGYIVEVSDNGGTADAQYFVGTATQFDFTLAMNDALYVTPNSTLYFKIYALDNSNQLSSDLTLTDTYPTMTMPSPWNPSVTSFPGGLNWSWAGPTENGDIVSHYQIDIDQAATSTDPFTSPVEKILGNSYVFAGTANTQYAARVRAFDLFGRSATSNPVANTTGAVTSGADTSPPTWAGGSWVTFNSTSTTPDGMASAKVSWPTATEPDSYIAGYFVRIKKSSEAGAAWTETYSSGTGTTHTFRNLAPGTAYNVEVAAQNAYGKTSSWIPIEGPTGPNYIFTTDNIAVTPVDSAAVSWTTPDLSITITDTVLRTQYFKGYEIDITKSGITKTFYATSFDKKVVVTATEWKSIWGAAAPSLLYTDIDVYAVDTNGQRSTVINPPNLTYEFAAPSAPTASTPTVGDGTATVTWTQSSTAVRYDVWALASANGVTAPTSTNLVASVPTGTLTATFPALVSDPTHRYKVIVAAVDVYGRATGSSAVITPVADAAPAITISAGIDAMRATWTPVPGSYYKLEVMPNGGNWSTILDRTTGGEGSWQTNGSTVVWTARLTPFNGIGTAGTVSTDTETAITIPGSDGTAPSTPTGLAVSNSPGTTEDGSASLLVTWTAPAAVDTAGYDIRWTTPTDNTNWTSTSMVKIAAPSTTESYLIRNLSPNTLYYVQVAAFDKSGPNRSEFTLSQSATTQPTPTIATPNGLLTGSFTTPDLSLSWTDGATYGTHFWGYQVRITTDAWATYKAWDVPRRSSGGGGTFILTNAENATVFGTAVTTFSANTIRVYAKDIYGKYSTAGGGYITNSGTGGNAGALSNAAPTSPGNVSFTYGNAGTITVNWATAVTDADFRRYKITVTNNAGSVSKTYFVDDKTITKLAIPFSENKAIFGGQHNIKATVWTEDVTGLTAVCSNGQQTASYPLMQSAGLLAVPTATPFLEGIALSWSAPTTTPDIVSYYDVDFEPYSGAALPFTSVDTVYNGTTFAKSGLTGGSAYKAGLRAVDIFGRTLLSTETNSVTATANAGISGNLTDPPGGANAPSFSASHSVDYAGVATTTITISYASKPTDFSHYAIRVATDSGGTNIIASGLTTSEKYTVYNLAKNTVYYYWIEAWDTEGRKNAGTAWVAASSTGSGTAMQSPTTGPLLASWVGNTLRISWTDGTTYTANTFGGYKVMLKNNTTNAWFTPNKFIDITPEQQNEVLGAAYYQFAVGEIDVTSYSALSPSVVGGTPLTNSGTGGNAGTVNKSEPAAVTNLNLYPAVGTITAKWDIGGSDAVKYRVYARAGSAPSAGATFLVYEGAGTAVTFNTQTANPGTTWYVEVYAVDAFNTASSATSFTAASKVVISGIESPTNAVATGTGKVTGTFTSPNLVLSWQDTETYPSGLFAGYRVTITANSKTYSWDVPQVTNGTEKGKLTLSANDQFNAFGTIVTSYAIGSVIVNARDINGKLSTGSISNNLTAITNLKPSPPNTLVTSTGTNSVTASWTEPGDTDVAKGVGSYRVQIHSDSARTAPNLVKELSVRNPTVTYIGLNPNTQYWIRIFSVDTLAQESDTQLDGTFTTASLTSDTTPPAELSAAPTLTAIATPAGKFKILVQWTYNESAVPDFGRYVVKWSSDGTTTWTGSAFVAGNSNAAANGHSYEIIDLPRSSATYRVYVEPQDLSSNAPSYNAAKSATVTAIAVTVPQPGTISTPVWTTPNLVISWVHATGSSFDVSSYAVEISTDGATWKRWVVPGTQNTITITPEEIKGKFGSYVKTFGGVGQIRLRVITISDTTAESTPRDYTGQFANSYSQTGTQPTLTAGVKAVSAKWTEVTDAVAYRLYTKSTSPVAATDTLIYEGNALNAAWQANAGAIYAGVVPVNIFGNTGSIGQTSTLVTVTDYAPDGTNPSFTPAGTYGTAVFNAIDQTWTLPISWAAASDASTPITYRVKYSISGARTVTTQTIYTDTTSVSITGLLSGDVVTALVAASDKYGNTTGDVAFTVPAATSTIPADTTGPSQPTGVSAVWQSGGGILVSWTNPTIPADYARTEVRFNTGTGDPGSTNAKAIKFVDRGTNSLLITDNELRTAYPSITATSVLYVWVSLYDTSNNAGTGTATSAARTAVPAPTMGANFTVSTDTVTASWSAVPGASGYRVFYGPSNPPTEYSESTGETAWRRTWLDNTNYFYAVASVDGLTGGLSALSTPIQRNVSTTTITRTGQTVTSIDVDGGNIGGWTIGTDNIRHSTGNIGLTAGSILDDTYGGRTIRLWSGGSVSSPQSGKLKIYDDGAISAALGRVGGWELLGSDIISTGSSVQSVFLPGTKTEYVRSSANQTALTSTGVIDIAVRLALSNYTTGGGASEYRTIIGSFSTNTIANDTLQWQLGIDGAGALFYNVTSIASTAYKAATPISSSIVADGQPIWIRAIANGGTAAYTGQPSYNETTGATICAGDTAAFYYGVANAGDTVAYSGSQVPLFWRPLGSGVGNATQTAFGASNLTSAAPIVIGSTNDTAGLGTKHAIVGKVSSAIIWQGTTKTASFLAADISKSTNTAPNGGSIGGTWSMFGTQSGFSAAAVEPLNSNSRFEKDASAWYVNGGTTPATRNALSLFGTGSLTIPLTTGAIYSDKVSVGGGKRYTATFYAYGATTNVKLRILPIQTMRPISRSSSGTTTKTLTFSEPHGLLVGDKIFASGLGGTGYDVVTYTAPATITAITSTSISYVGTGTVTENVTYTGVDSPVVEVIHDYYDRLYGVNITSGQATLTGSGFTSAMQGRQIVVVGAGAAGANLTTTVQTYNTPTSLTLANTAGTTVTSGVAWIDTPSQEVMINSTYNVNSTSWSTAPYSISIVPRPSVSGIRLLVTNTNASACYVDGVRLEAGSSNASYGYAYSATDSIRLESTGSVNVVNDYGRIDLTNRKESDTTVSIAGATANSLIAPTMRFINTGKDGRASQDIPAEISTTLDINSYGLVNTTGNSLLLHSGSIYGLIGSTDETLISRKRRTASIVLNPNTNAAAGPLTGDSDPATSMSLSADAISISSSSVNISAPVTATSVISDKIIQGDVALSTLRGIGQYTTYADFAQEQANSVDHKGSDFAIVDGILWTKDDSRENLFIDGNIVTNPNWSGQTSYSDSDIGGAYGSVRRNTSGAIVTGFNSTSLATELYVQVAVKPNGGVDRTTGQVVATVQFYQADGTTQTGTATVSNTSTITTGAWSILRGYVSVPANTTQFRLSVADAGNDFSMGKIFTKKSTRVDYASGLAITSGTNLVTATGFDASQVGCEIVINGAGAAGANLTTVITGWLSSTQIYVETNASTTVASAAGLIRDEYYLTPVFNSWYSSGNIIGPAGPATEWTVVANTLEAGSQATADVTGASPNNTLTLGIPKGDATFAQVASVAPVARAEGDLWFDPSLTTTVSSLDISNADSYGGTLFNTGLRIYNQGAMKAQIDSSGIASFATSSVALTLSGTWTNFGGSYRAPTAFRDANGFVRLEGIVVNTTSFTPQAAGTGGGYTICNLPANYRPAYNVIFLCMAQSSHSDDFGAYVTVVPGGDVTVSYITGYDGSGDQFITTACTMNWLSLNQISFKAA